MTMTSTKLKAEDVAPAAVPARRDPVDSIGGPRLRLTLESAWERKIDEVIVLSKASCGLTADGDDSAVDCGVRTSRRLQARIARAYNELAALEVAIARLEPDRKKDDSTAPRSRTVSGIG